MGIEQNFRSENSELDAKIFSTKEELENLGSDSEILPTSTDHLVEAVSQKDFFKPDGLYTKKILALHGELLKIEGYLKAKDNQSKLAFEISNLLTERPRSGLVTGEKIAELQKYDYIITAFEQNNVPEEVYKEAREEYYELKSALENFVALEKVAKENPSLN